MAVFKNEVLKAVRDSNRGFSYIEIIIVICITGIIVAVLLPDFSKTIGRYNLNTSARELVSDVRSIEQAAIKYEEAGFKIQFIGDSLYVLTYFLNNSYLSKKTVKLPSTIKYNANLTSNNINNNYNSLIFQANGRPSGGIGGHICLQDRRTGICLYIVIDTIGRVRISETLP